MEAPFQFHELYNTAFFALTPFTTTMRSTLLIALAAVSAPIYAAPLRPTICDRLPQLCLPQPNIVTRQEYTSEAINWGSIAKVAAKALPKVIGWFDG